MKVIILLHGLKDPNNNGLLRMRETLESGGYLVRAVNYGMFMLRGMGPLWYLFNPPLAKMLACFVELLTALGHPVTIIAHSNGATIAVKASQYGAPFRAMILVNGAVGRSEKLGDKTGVLLNCCAPGDPVLTLARIISPISPWSDILGGSLGKEGVPANSDARMWNVNMQDMFGVDGWDSHAEIISPTNANRFAAWCITALRVHAGL